MTLKRVNPKDIPYIQKEAVTDGLLGALALSCAGGTAEQETIIGFSPMDRLASGMLVPAPQLINEYADEVESTIHISALGIDTLINDEESLTIKMKPKGAVFVRILPTESDLQDERYITEFRPNEELKKRIKETKKSIFNGPGDDYTNKQKRFNDEAKTILASALKLPETPELNTTSEEDELGETTISAVFQAKPGTSLSVNTAALELQEVVEKYFRIEVEFSEQTIQLCPSINNDHALAKVTEFWQMELTDRIKSWANDKAPLNGGIHWAYNRKHKFTFDQIKNWKQTLAEIAEERMVQGQVDIATLDCPSNLSINLNVNFTQSQSQKRQHQLHIELANSTEINNISDTQNPNNILFNAGFTVAIPTHRHKALQMERVKPSFRFKDYLTFNAQGFNIGVESKTVSNWLYINTTWLPRYYQPRIAPNEHGKIPLTFKQLKTKEGVHQLASLPTAFKSWITAVQQHDPTSGQDNPSDTTKSFETNQYQKACDLWKEECYRIERGIGILYQAANAPEGTEEQLPFLAWQALNESMEIANKNKFDGWRTFQLAFILNMLPTITSRIPTYQQYYDPKLDKAVQLLYFATGGGKSEAFYGVLIYQLFIDRLRGKARGVTAMISYPLRLLTTQQAQRLSKILAFADQVRVNKKMGGEAFSIGFWVGGGNTPNSNGTPILQELVPTVGHEQESTAAELNYQLEINKLPKCPYCNSATILRRIPKWDDQVGIFCPSHSCQWNDRHNTHIPLPFYITDDDIYARAPSILVGTVDKLSQIAYEPTKTQLVLGMFGGALARDKSSGRLISPKLIRDKNALNNPNWVRLFPASIEGEKWFFDPFPAFRVADEVHLLEESLGSFTGLYETLFKAMLEELSSSLEPILVKDKNRNVRFPEYIAATATVADPEHQIRNLYMRPCFQFPSPGNTLYESFYAGPATTGQPPCRISSSLEPEDYAARARIYASMLTNGKAHTTAAVDVLASFHLLISKMILKLKNGDLIVVKQQILKGLGDTVAKPFYQDAIKSIDTNSLATLIDLHRIALTYVTNKKGGDQVITAERDRDERWHSDAGIENIFIDPQLISGDLSLGQIEEVVKNSEANREPGTTIEINDGIRSVVATSAVSHGVDVEQYNSMFFAGMPNDTAEFIQASSRIGRTHTGFSLLLPTPQRRRDRYIVEVNQPYYRFLERMILPPAIDRWADNAIRRTISSFFVAYLGVNAQVQQSSTDNQTFNRRYSSRYISSFQDNPKKRNKLLTFMVKAYGLNDSNNGLSLDSISYYKDMIEAFLLTDIVSRFIKNAGSEDLFNYLQGLDEKGASKQKLYSTMTSLRDISETGKISPLTTKQVTFEDFIQMMEFISQPQGGQ